MLRRDFLRHSSLAAAACVTGRSALRAQENSAKSVKTIRAAVCGVKGRGKDHIKALLDNGISVTHLVDVDPQWFERAAKLVTDVGQPQPQFVTDYRELIATGDIDVITFATPNHLHSLQAIEALQAGKHVYVEKPVSHNVWEGRQLVHAADAAEKKGLLCQCGTQSRSSESLREAQALVQDGLIGEIQYAVGTCYKPRMPIGQRETPLDTSFLDYERWAGPAAKVDILRPQLHYDWHWDWNTGNGDMGNQGIHQMDIARWFLGENALSPSVRSVGGRLGYVDAGDTPNTQTVVHRYEKPLIFETRGLPRSIEHRPKWGPKEMDEYRGSRIGVIVQGTDGYVVIPSYTRVIHYDAGGTELKKWEVAGGREANARHFKNLLDAVAAGGDRSMLNGDILEGHLSSALCHTGGVSHQVGQLADKKTIMEAVRGDGTTAEMYADSVSRMIDHLAANDVDVTGLALTLGADLTMDPATETFTAADPSSALGPATERLRREYREGFEVPDLS